MLCSWALYSVLVVSCRVILKNSFGHWDIHTETFKGPLGMRTNAEVKKTVSFSKFNTLSCIYVKWSTQNLALLTDVTLFLLLFCNLTTYSRLICLNWQVFFNVNVCFALRTVIPKWTFFLFICFLSSCCFGVVSCCLFLF